MKKSQKYHMAMIAVVNSNLLVDVDKLDVLELLIQDKNMAEYLEEPKEKAE